MILTAIQCITTVRLRRVTCLNIFASYKMSKNMKISLKKWAKGISKETEKKKIKMANKYMEKF